MFWLISILIICVVILFVVYYFRKNSLKRLVTKINWDNVKYLSEDDIIKMPFNPEVYNEEFDVIYIGSGISAMVGACLAAVHGKKVLILEQNDQIGGLTHTWIEDDKYEFSPGVHFIPESGALERLLSTLTNGRITFKNCTKLGEDEIRVKVFDNSDNPEILDVSYVVPSGEDTERNTMKNFVREYYDKYENDMELPKISKIISHIDNFWDDAMSTAKQIIWISIVRRYIPLCLRSIVIWILKLFGFKVFKWMNMTINEYMWEVFPGNNHLSSILRSIVTRYIYGDPKKVTALVPLSTMGIIANKRRKYPIGGSQTIGAELTKTIRACDGKAYCIAPVTEIVLDDNDHAIGVKVDRDDRIISAKTVISCCGIVNTYNKLLPSHVRPTNFDSYTEPSRQTVGMTLGYECPHQDLGLDELIVWFINSDLLGSIDQLYQSDGIDKCLKNPPYIGISNGSLGHLLKDGTTALQIVSPSRWKYFSRWEELRIKNRGSEYKDEKERAMFYGEEIIFNEYPQLKEQIDHQAYYTPLSFEHWCGSPRGEFYGTCVNIDKIFNMFDDCIKTTGKVKGGLIISGVDTILLACVQLSALSGIFSAMQITGNMTLGLDALSEQLFF